MTVVVNPATEESIAEIPEASAEDADRAVEAARRAFPAAPGACAARPSRPLLAGPRAPPLSWPTAARDRPTIRPEPMSTVAAPVGRAASVWTPRRASRTTIRQLSLLIWVTW